MLEVRGEGTFRPGSCDHRSWSAVLFAVFYNLAELVFGRVEHTEKQGYREKEEEERKRG